MALYGLSRAQIASGELQPGYAHFSLSPYLRVEGWGEGLFTMLKDKIRCDSPHPDRCAIRALPAGGESDCLSGQAFLSCHGDLSRKIALRMVSSFRATAMMATSLGLPAATSLSRNSLSVGLKRAATMAPMNRTRRTLARPPPMKLLPRHWPDCRVQGASPTRAAICRRS